jgi:hypothetical protein
MEIPEPDTKVCLLNSHHILTINYDKAKQCQYILFWIGKAYATFKICCNVVGFLAP